MALEDTSEKAREFYFRRLREMTPSERLKVAAGLWEAGNSLQRAGIRFRNPHADEAEITFQVAVNRFGLELAKKVHRRT